MQYLPEFNIGRRNLNGVKYEMTLCRWQILKQRRDNVGKENKKNQLTINTKKTRCMVVSERISRKCELCINICISNRLYLCIEDVKIKQTDIQFLVIWSDLRSGRAE